MSNSLSSSHCQIEIAIAASRQAVWEALVNATHQWWPADFCTSERTQRFVIEPVLGGRVYEDFGDGDGLEWYSVVGVQTQVQLLLSGDLLPPFGGPAKTALTITLSECEQGTLLQIRDDRFGVLGGDSPEAGWKVVFDDGLRSFLEA